MVFIEFPVPGINQIGKWKIFESSDLRLHSFFAPLVGVIEGSPFIFFVDENPITLQLLSQIMEHDFDCLIRIVLV